MGYMDISGAAAFKAWEDFRHEMAKRGEGATIEKKELPQEEIGQEKQAPIEKKPQERPKVGEPGYLEFTREFYRESRKKGNERWFGKKGPEGRSIQ